MRSTSPASTNTGQIVLVVEDNEDLRENAALVLTLEGYQVFSARDGQDAMDLLNSGQCHPDLIVSDIAMPRLDGYAFFEAVHNMPSLRAVPFIFLTARGSRRDIRFGKELGADDYLVKPFNADDFMVAVRSKLRRNEEIRQQAESELDDARRLMVQLLSHELRTPLTYVTGGFSLLAEGLEQDSLPSDMQMSMGLIRSGTQRLNHLAEQLVLYAELISGHSRMQMQTLGEWFDLILMIKDAVSLVEQEALNRSIKIKCYLDDLGTVEVFTVQDLLRTAFHEVIRNAVAYSADGGEVNVQLTVSHDEATFVVTDQGRGIPPEDQESIWDIMVQSERTKHEQQGAGMGLPIVKQLMLLHGGTASLKSEVGRGTVVTLRFPLDYNADAARRNG